MADYMFKNMNKYHFLIFGIILFLISSFIVFVLHLTSLGIIVLFIAGYMFQVARQKLFDEYDKDNNQ
jgi:predicted membrane protein